MLPKDYLAYKLSGVFATDVSDASGMLLFDVKNRDWSAEMMKICDVRRDQLAQIFESYEVIGNIKADVAADLGFNPDVKIIAGAGDNAAAAVGTGTVSDGDCNISLGTSGTIFISSDKFTVDEKNGLHAFAHSNGAWHLMGCMLSAASCNKWWMEDILNTKDFAGEQANLIEKMNEFMGNNDIFFLPYLMGERSPLNDTSARGAFVGMRMDSTREEMTLAILEGVAFALRDSYEVARSQGINISRTKMCGGGAKSVLWRNIIANVFNMEVDIPVAEEGPAMGGAMLAAVGCGVFGSVKEAADAIVKVKETIKPDPEIAARYEKKYQIFRSIYPSLKSIYKMI